MDTTAKFMDKMRSSQHHIYRQTVTSLFRQITAIPKSRSQENSLNKLEKMGPTDDER
jgi:hypothetical protein